MNILKRNKKYIKSFMLESPETLKNKNISWHFNLASSDINYQLNGLNEFCIYFTTHDKDNKTRRCFVYTDDKLIIDNKKFSVPQLYTYNELLEFVNSIKIAVHNEYMEHLLENM